MTKNAFDEMNGTAGDCRAQYRRVEDWLKGVSPDLLTLKRREAELLFKRIGITFAVYSEGGDPERLIPFDIIPRILDQAEWSHIARGLEQRVKALNAFIWDVYHEREIIRAGKVPEALVLHNESFRPEMQSFDVPQRIYTHIAGIDMVRVGPEDFYVLEDNCRTPSGVSYMIEDREVMMRLFPELFESHDIAPVSHYPEELLGVLRLGGAAELPGRADRRPADPGLATTAPTTSTASWPTRWASTWSRARISSSRTTSSTCARRAG